MLCQRKTKIDLCMRNLNKENRKINNKSSNYLSGLTIGIVQLEKSVFKNPIIIKIIVGISFFYL